MTSMKTEATTRPPGQLDSTHHLIESDRVEGTAVLNRDGVKIGTVERLMIDKVSGQVVYAVISAGGFLGIGESYHPVPWGALNFNKEEGAYVVDADRDRLRAAPSYPSRDALDLHDPDSDATRRIHEHYGVLYAVRTYTVRE